MFQKLCPRTFRSELTALVLGYFLFLSVVAGVVIGLFNISAKNIEANSAAVPTEQTDHKKSKPHKPQVLARQRDDHEGSRDGPLMKQHKKTLYMSTRKNGSSKASSNGGY